MRDAIGGVLSINLIIFVLFLVSGYLAYSVNYTKAFRVKNEIVNIIEEYEGLTGNAQDEIKKVTSRMGYTVPGALVSSMKAQGFCCFDRDGYCVSATPSGTSTSSMNDDYQGWVYTVITYVNINVPVLNKMEKMSVHLMQLEVLVVLLNEEERRNL